MSCGELGKGAKTEHTPEPLNYMPIPAADGTFMVLGGQGQGYGLVASCTTEEDARRIVACVNACAGMTNEQIDNVCMISGSLLNRFGEQMAYLGQVEKQRDELLDVFQLVIAEMEHRDRNDGNAPGHGHGIPGVWDSDNGALAGKPCAWCAVWKKAKELCATIARVKGGAA